MVPGCAETLRKAVITDYIPFLLFLQVTFVIASLMTTGLSQSQYPLLRGGRSLLGQLTPLPSSLS
jgi:hypothetical protein